MKDNPIVMEIEQSYISDVSYPSIQRVGDVRYVDGYVALADVLTTGSMMVKMAWCMRGGAEKRTSIMVESKVIL
jgi:hypothetical protein